MTHSPAVLTYLLLMPKATKSITALIRIVMNFVIAIYDSLSTIPPHISFNFHRDLGGGY
jgi:hypothetical protein